MIKDSLFFIMNSKINENLEQNEELILEIKEKTIDLYKFDKIFVERLKNLEIIFPNLKNGNIRDYNYILKELLSNSKIFLEKNNLLISKLFKLIINIIPENKAKLLDELFELKILNRDKDFQI